MSAFFKRTVLGVLAAFCLGGAAYADDVVIGIQSEPSSLDPHFHNTTPNSALLGLVFARLVEWSPGKKLVPGLAESWKSIDDNTWEFKLRKGVKFHDGSDFTADDVIFSYKRADQYVGGNAGFQTYTKGKTLKKIDDHTLHIITKTPYPLMPNDASTILIHSADIKGTGEKDKNFGIQPKDFNNGDAVIGTGPYKLVEWKKGDRLVLQKFAGYKGPLAQEWDKVTYKFIKSGPSRVAALLAGDVDMIDIVPVTDIEALKKNDKVALHQGLSSRIMYLHMDKFRQESPFVTDKNGTPLKKNPLLDPRVRKALSLMIDRDSIVKNVMGGLATPAGQLLPDGFFGRSPNLKPDPYDPAAAKKLLAEAGYGNGFSITLHGPNDRYVNDAKITEAIGQMLSANGIPTKVVTLPKNVFFKRATTGGPKGVPEFSMFLSGWGSATGEPTSPLKSLLTTHDKSKGSGVANRGRHSDPEVDRLVWEALGTVNDDKRAALLVKATERAIGQNQGIIPVHFLINTWATRKGLKYDPRVDERTLATDLHKAK